MIRKKLRSIYYNSTLATKIRYSYLIVLIPAFLLLIFCVINYWQVNKKYEDMINSAVEAGDFSLDFKKDFDYETYLLIVGNKTIEDSGLDKMLDEATQVVDNLFLLTDSEENRDRLTSARKFLDNLSRYKGRIEENIIEGNKYEDNLLIWENDVQIVTGLLRETVIQYIYYEIKDIQQARDKYQEMSLNIVRAVAVAAVLLAIISFVLSYYIPLSITKPIRNLCDVTEEVSKGNLEIRSDVDVGAEVGVLSDSLNLMIDKINELLDQVKAEQIRLRKAELELLQSQINPHFLYNTLDAIVWLAESGEQKKVVSMVESLSKFFRTSLNQGKEIINLKEELQHVRSYLEIQQVRYQDILDYEIDVPEELYEYLIPKITIQPLVENALYHGIKNKRGKGSIKISGEVKADGFVLYIRDNGIGMTDERLLQIKERIHGNGENKGEIFGLFNVNERIRLKFGEEYGLNIESAYNEGTTVSVFLPKNKEI